MQAFWLNLILKREKRDKNPRSVPTGQMVLQYSLPEEKLIQTIIANKAEANRMETILMFNISAGETVYISNFSRRKTKLLFI